jgi:hypothetical protein
MENEEEGTLYVCAFAQSGPGVAIFLGEVY